MMKLHVCPECKYRVLTSRRIECECKTCQVLMLKVDTVGFEQWWQMSEGERDKVVDDFLKYKNSRTAG